MWSEIVHDLQKSGHISADTVHLHVFMDYVVIVCKIPSLSECSPEEADKKVSDVRVELAKKMFDRFRMKTDLIMQEFNRRGQVHITEPTVCRRGRDTLMGEDFGKTEIISDILPSGPIIYSHTCLLLCSTRTLIENP